MNRLFRKSDSSRRDKKDDDKGKKGENEGSSKDLERQAKEEAKERRRVEQEMKRDAAWYQHGIEEENRLLQSGELTLESPEVRQSPLRDFEERMEREPDLERIVNEVLREREEVHALQRHQENSSRW